MALGRKTGGRAAGTPNRLTLNVIERLNALGCDPIEGMARIAMSRATPVEVRARMFAELAGYVAPKRKAIDHTTNGRAIDVPIAVDTGPQLDAVVAKMRAFLNKDAPVPSSGEAATSG